MFDRREMSDYKIIVVIDRYRLMSLLSSHYWTKKLNYESNLLMKYPHEHVNTKIDSPLIDAFATTYLRFIYIYMIDRSILVISRHFINVAIRIHSNATISLIARLIVYLMYICKYICTYVCMHVRHAFMNTVKWFWLAIR